MRRKSQAGQALVFAAIGMTMLLGFAGLAIDLGVLRYEKRLQQSAADAAALAGASNLCRTGNCTGYSGVSAGGQQAAAQDGFTDGGSGLTSSCTSKSAAVGTVCVQINNPPDSGPHQNNPNYVEAIVSEVRPTYFMKALKVDKQLVAARAVATNLAGVSNNQGCLYTLNPPKDGIQGVGVQGSAVLNAPTCGILDNGQYDPTGGALKVTANTFGVSGGCNGSGCSKTAGEVTCNATPDSCPTYNIPPASDPLHYLAPPANPGPPAGCKAPCNAQTSGGTTSNPYVLNPGEYSSIAIGKNSVVMMNPGIYYIDGSGGISFKGSATLTGSGVMIYFTGSASINATGGGNQTANIQLSAPTSGPYAGILMYQDPADTNVGGKPNSGPTLGGDNTSYFDGALYFPADELTFFGNAKSSNCGPPGSSGSGGYSIGMVVTGGIQVQGNPTVCLQGLSGMPTGVDVVKVATLVE